MNVVTKRVIFFSLFILLSCSVDFSLLNNRQCDNEGRCLAGYICDRTTMTCVKEGSLSPNDTGIPADIPGYDYQLHDTEPNDIYNDILCVPTNNGKEICDGIDNNCDGRTDEDYVCGSCVITGSITEKCDETTKCNTCFIVGGEKYICVSENGSEFSWKKESETECTQAREGHVVRCENRCFLCEGGKYSDSFIINTESCDKKDNNCNGQVDEGDICKTFEVCIDGQCVEKPCSKNEDCPIGKICKNSKCVSCQDVTDDSLCGSGKICVNGACIQGDCHQNSDCSAGICVSNRCCPDCCTDKKDCPPELICKQGKCTQCIDGIEDLACGLGYICEDKKCIKGDCHPDLGSYACPLSDKICVNYSCCKPGPTCCLQNNHCKNNMYCTQSFTCECSPGYGDCNGLFDDGCEKNLKSDINNCGVCKQVCSLPNADPECSNGKCIIKNCKANFKDCNQKAEDGCEINITNDKLNCSDCNKPCQADNASVKCEQSKCVISACELGYADCDGKYETGCETDITKDNNNCGECRNPCGANTNCTNGKCL
ncbi:MAG: MopE-related protein [Deltaproteobacteria bacterium]|nr:MopE-related protein [Deltaproteobacteria bacterium]